MFQNDLIPSDLRIPKFHKNKKVVVMLAVIDRGSRLQMFIKIGVLKNFTTITGEHLRWP